MCGGIQLASQQLHHTWLHPLRLRPVSLQLTPRERAPGGSEGTTQPPLLLRQSPLRKSIPAEFVSHVLSCTMKSEDGKDKILHR